MDSFTFSVLGVRVESIPVKSDEHSLITESMTSSNLTDTVCEIPDTLTCNLHLHRQRDTLPVTIGCGVHFPKGLSYEINRLKHEHHSQIHRSFFRLCRRCITKVCKQYWC